MKDAEILIIPDVHGRTFWREPVNKALNDIGIKRIIFLGDYVDPYRQEGITPEDALNVFREIIDIKKNNMDKVVLLVGNHDSSYMFKIGRGCRYDYFNGEIIENLFDDNFRLFSLVHSEVVNGKTFLFTHAGVNPMWIREHSDFFGIDDETKIDFDFIKGVDWMNRLSEKGLKLMDMLCECSSWRGGESVYSSLIWCDVFEHISDKSELPGCIQVFGHTQQRTSPVRWGDFLYCLDCRREFYITSEGIIVDSDGKEPDDNGQDLYDAYLDYLKKYEGCLIF